MTPEERLADLGLELPPAPEPMAAYVPFVRTGDLVFVSGQGPVTPGQPIPKGKVPDDVPLERAQELARTTCLNGLAIVRSAVGELSKVRRVVKLTVFVASSPGFDSQHLVANGASELLGEVFGDAGRHARAAVGVAELPFGIPVEIAFVFEVE